MVDSKFHSVPPPPPSSPVFSSSFNKRVEQHAYSPCSTASTSAAHSPSDCHNNKPSLSPASSSSREFVESDFLFQRFLSSYHLQSDSVCYNPLAAVANAVSSYLPPPEPQSAEQLSSIRHFATSGPQYSTAFLLRCRSGLQSKTNRDAEAFIRLIDRVVDDNYLTFPARPFAKPFQQSNSLVDLGLWRSGLSDVSLSAAAHLIPYFKSCSADIHQSLQSSQNNSFSLVHGLNSLAEPHALRDWEDSGGFSHSCSDLMGPLNANTSACRSFDSIYPHCGLHGEAPCNNSSSDNATLDASAAQATAVTAAATEFSSEFSSELFSEAAADDSTQKLLPRYVAAFSLSNLGIHQSSLTGTSPRRVLPFGHPNYFMFLKSLPRNEFVYLATSVARYRRTSRLYPSPSTIVSINLCSCCTPHPAPVSGVKFENAFWEHHLPSQSHLHGVLDTSLSLMLLELHPGLEVVEFLDRRLPAIIRQQVGNRLDRNFVVQIFGVSFMRTHLLLNNWTVGQLPECTDADLHRLRSHPLYHHMLYDISNRRELPVFRNINLCPISYSANRRLPSCGAQMPIAAPFPPPPPAVKSLSALSSAPSTACSSSENVCGSTSVTALLPRIPSSSSAAAAINV